MLSCCGKLRNMDLLFQGTYTSSKQVAEHAGLPSVCRKQSELTQNQPHLLTDAPSRMDPATTSWDSLVQIQSCGI